MLGKLKNFHGIFWYKVEYRHPVMKIVIQRAREHITEFKQTLSRRFIHFFFHPREFNLLEDYKFRNRIRIFLRTHDSISRNGIPALLPGSPILHVDRHVLPSLHNLSRSRNDRRLALLRSTAIRPRARELFFFWRIARFPTNALGCEERIIMHNPQRAAPLPARWCNPR